MPVKIATNYPGVRCYEHATRTYKRRPDRYFSIRYRTAAGKRVEEGVGWASEGWTAEEASRIRSQIRQNTKLGTGPQSLQAFSKPAAPPPQSVLPQTFEDLALCYLKWAERNKKSWTTDYYLLTRRIFPLFGDRPVASITRADMEQFRDNEPAYPGGPGPVPGHTAVEHFRRQTARLDSRCLAGGAL